MNPEGAQQNFQDWKFPNSPESESRPEKLFRAITIKPENLTVERLRQPLVPGTVSKDDPSKIGDGNELGVYMSTNPDMVETAYAKGGLGVDSVPVPPFAGPDGYSQRIPLPSCGVFLEIDTKGLEIRKPQISPVLRGVYNNGFEGQEWIADKISADHFRVKKIMLSRWANDSETFVVDIENSSDEKMQEAIDIIKAEFARRRAAAEEFKSFLEALSDTQRKNRYVVKQEWEKWQEKKKAGLRLI